MRVRCVDNMLHTEVLEVGKEYAVDRVDPHSKNYRLEEINVWFHPRRFVTVSAKTLVTNQEQSSEVIEDATFRPPVERYRGK